MKTEALIDLLAADGPPRRSYGRAALLAAGVALAGALTGLALTLGIRPDVLAALQTFRFPEKLAFAAALALAALLCLTRAGRPEARALSACAGLLMVAAVLGLMVLAELAIVPAGDWRARMVGTNAAVCLVAIPALSLVPLAAFLVFMRQAAPRSAPWAGAACGLAAGAVGALAYALHCPDDSPLFVAVWYLVAIGGVTLAGSLIGARLLRW